MYTSSSKGVLMVSELHLVQIISISLCSSITLQSPLPPQSMSLTITDNKVQIIALICNNLPAQFQKEPCNHCLLITGPDSVPIEISQGLEIGRHDMEIKHEEADAIIINQVASAASQGSHDIHVVSDDTDVFILLLHYYKSLNLTCLIMKPTSSKRCVVDKSATAKKYNDIVPHLLISCVDLV